MSIYNYLVKKPNGEVLSMETYRDHVILIVNTAGHCMFTYQYEDLQKLYDKYKNQKFVVLSFPCNQFGEQNPEDGQTTATQCRVQFGVTYPVFDIVEVNGEKTHPLYNYLKHEVDCPVFVPETMQQKLLYDGIEKNYPEYLIGRNIRWNFTKFIVDRKGKVLQRFEPDTSFLDIEQRIESVL